MRKIVLKSSFLVGILSLLLSLPCCSGSLKDITKPYLGEYECKSAVLGDKEFLEEFAYIRLELKEDETFILHYKTKTDKTGEETGAYVYDKEKKSITLRAGENGVIEREFPLSGGQIDVTLPIGNKTLHLRFEQK